MDAICQDIKLGVRRLATQPAFTVVVVLTLGLGIGANTAVFNVVNALLLRPMPVTNPEQITVVTSVRHPGNEQPGGISYLDYLDYRANAAAFQDMSAFRWGLVGLSADNRAEQILISYVTSNFFSMFGIEPAAGRLIQPGEGDVIGTDPIVVLGHSYWKRRFGGDPAVAGRNIRVNGRAYTIIGVVPETFLGGSPFVEMDGYIPIGMAGLEARNRDMFTRRDDRRLYVHGRLRAGDGVRQGQASLDVIARRLAQQYPDTNGNVDVRIVPEVRARPEPSYAQLNPLIAGVFLALAGLVLLAACVNVTNLLFVRANARQKELAVRAALGAGRSRLVRQWFTESLLLALLGGVTGVLLGVWVSDLIATIRLPTDMIPVRFDFPFDWRGFAFAALLVVLTTLLVGTLPALRASRTELTDALREGGRTQATGRHRLRNTLVVAQVAVSLVLAIVSGLFVRSLGNARQLDLGFRPEGVLNVSMNPAQQGYDEARGRAFFRELKERVRSLPGAQSASWAFAVPLGYFMTCDDVDVEGRPVAKDELRPRASCNFIDPDYFDTMRVTLLRGRGITEHDTHDSRRVAVINETMANQLWPDQEPLGKRFSFTGPDGPWVEVVGLAKNGKYDFIFEDPTMYFYAPIEQNYRSARTLHVRVTGAPPSSLGLAVQKEVRALDADLPVYDVQTMTESLQGGNGFFLLKAGAGVAAALGALGLVLAMIGVYGVASSAASQRTHEIGIRMALGADQRDILRLVLQQGFVFVLAGLGMGVLVSLALARFIGRLLLGIAGHDPLTFGGVSLLLGAVALVACWIPARRAARIGPMVALK